MDKKMLDAATVKMAAIGSGVKLMLVS